MSAASRQTSVPFTPMAIPMSALRRATASLTPSPHMPTVWPTDWSALQSIENHTAYVSPRADAQQPFQVKLTANTPKSQSKHKKYDIELGEKSRILNHFLLARVLGGGSETVTRESGPLVVIEHFTTVIGNGNFRLPLKQNEELCNLLPFFEWSITFQNEPLITLFLERD